MRTFRLPLPIVLMLATFAVSMAVAWYGPLLEARWDLRAIENFHLSTRMLVRHFDQESGELGRFCEVFDGANGKKLGVVSATWGVPLVLFQYEADPVRVEKENARIKLLFGVQLVSYCKNGETLVVHASSVK